MNIIRKGPPSSVLGLCIDGGRIEGVVLRRSGSSLQPQKTLAAPLALNPMTGAPELVGREIRNHLKEAGIRERACVVCVPLNWVLTLQTKLPDLPEADVDSFLQIEAERGFPYGQEALLFSTSRFRAASGEQYALQLAIPRNHLVQLQQALKAARLEPLSFSLGISALQKPATDPAYGILALGIGESSVDLQVTCGGGVAALRALEGAMESEGMQKRLYADVLAREIRITLGQLPPEFRGSVRRLRIFGRGDMAHRFVQDISPRVEAMGMRAELVQAYTASDELGSSLPPDATVSPALSVAGRFLMGDPSPFEFLPPKTNAWKQITTRFSSKKLAWVGGAAAAAALLLMGAFGIQQWELSRLQSQWVKIEPQYVELDSLQQQIRKYRPWFDESFRTLTILKRVTEAFPEESGVSAKSIEIRDTSAVTCTGTARDNQALYAVIDKLRGTKEAANVKVDQTRGTSPVQFTFNFQWTEGGRN